MSYEFELPTGSVLYADSARGVYIPQYFAESVAPECLRNVSEESLKILAAGPDAEFYWEEWETVLDNARLVDSSGREFILWQDGDLWAVPVDSIGRYCVLGLSDSGNVELEEFDNERHCREFVVGYTRFGDWGGYYGLAIIAPNGEWLETFDKEGES